MGATNVLTQPGLKRLHSGSADPERRPAALTGWLETYRVWGCAPPALVRGWPSVSAGPPVRVAASACVRTGRRCDCVLAVRVSGVRAPPSGCWHRATAAPLLRTLLLPARDGSRPDLRPAPGHQSLSRRLKRRLAVTGAVPGVGE